MWKSIPSKIQMRKEGLKAKKGAIFYSANLKGALPYLYPAQGVVIALNFHFVFVTSMW